MARHTYAALGAESKAQHNDVDTTFAAGFFFGIGLH